MLVNYPLSLFDAWVMFQDDPDEDTAMIYCMIAADYWGEGLIETGDYLVVVHDCVMHLTFH